MAIPQPQCVPVYKSLLKKSPNSDKSAKHNRNVSFNQTVIVFCEEVETPSPSDQFEPPIGYQDTLDSFEPPEDYSDQKVATSKDDTATELNESYGRTLDECAANLTDDQLIGLLEDEFKLNCEDLSEEDFPINYLNSDHSYLCVDAISDYDSDSESSLFVERKETGDIHIPTSSTTAPKVELDSDASQLNKGHVAQAKSSNPPNESKADRAPEHSQISDVEPTKAPSRQMPARVKVSTVDNNHPKRQQNRKEDQDLRSKLELTNHRKDAATEHKASEVLTSGDKSSNPAKVKQSNVEPVPLSRSVIVNTVNNTVAEADSSTHRRLGSDDSCQAPISGQIVEESNTTQRESITHTQTLKPRYFEQANVIANQTSRNAQSQIACHICRASDPINRPPAAAPFKDQKIEQDNIKVQPGTLQIVKKADGQPDTFNQACVSCRETLIKQNFIRDSAHIQPTGSAHARPVTYQLVYVVDQKGNRVRALSLRPASQVPNPQQQPLNGRRILIAQNNVRFPNPAAINGHPVSFSTNQLPPNQWSQNQPLTNQAPQYRIVGAIPPPQIQQNQSLSNSGKIANGLVRVPLDGHGLRQHTVYYVRQPLDAQNLSQRLDPTSSSSKSFPDPHEVRRLDGLREPFINPNMSIKNDQTDAGKQQNVKSYTASSKSRDETDDPTFGFSNRPSVKVVATNTSFVNTLINRSQNQQSSVKAQYTLTNGKSAVRHYIDPTGTLRPVSLLIAGSQTLGRRQLNQQPQTMKENVPSTSSMSNIHGTMSSLAQGQSSKVNSQQRISNNQSSNPSTSGFKPQEAKNVQPESDTGMILNNRVAPLVLQNGQSSSHKGKDATYDTNRTTQVAYSMNI